MGRQRMRVAFSVLLLSVALGAFVFASEVELMQEADPDASTAMASSAHAKADLALSKIKTAKELRAKARESLTAKGKPIPEILKAGALDDVSQRGQDAKSKLTAKFGETKTARRRPRLRPRGRTLLLPPRRWLMRKKPMPLRRRLLPPPRRRTCTRPS